MENNVIFFLRAEGLGYFYYIKNMKDEILIQISMSPVDLNKNELDRILKTIKIEAITNKEYNISIPYFGYLYLDNNRIYSSQQPVILSNRDISLIMSLFKITSNITQSFYGSNSMYDVLKGTY